TASLAAGTHTITASYSGNGNFIGSIGTLLGGQTVSNRPTTASTTVVSSSANPSVFGQGVSFTATVSPSGGSGTATGAVQFMLDGSNFGNSVSLAGGVATSGTISSLSVSNHTIRAVYSGDPTFAGSTGSFTQTVNQASTSTSVTSSANPSVV